MQEESAKSLGRALTFSVARDLAAVVLSPTVIAEGEGRILFVNAAVTSALGWEEHQVVGQNLHDTLIPERYREAHQVAIERLKATGKPTVLLRELPLAALRADGTEVPCLIQINARPLGDNQWLYFANLVIQPEPEEPKATGVWSWLRG